MKTFLKISCVLLSILCIGLSIVSLKLLNTTEDVVKDNENLKVSLERVTINFQDELRRRHVEYITIDNTKYDNSVVTIEDTDFSLHVSEEDAVVLAKMIWGETRLVKGFYAETRYVSNTEQIAATVWTVLNRVDAGLATSIIDAVTAFQQYAGYSEENPVEEAYVNLAKDCIIRWQLEKILESFGMNSDVGRVLPKPTETEKWCWFVANSDTTHNLFRGSYESLTIYDWSLSTPYEYDMPIY